MRTPNDGGPAFPWREEDGGGGYCQHKGMSLRDWFAGQALTGIVLSPLGSGGRVTFLSTARDAYRYADAMLAERGNGGAS